MKIFSYTSILTFVFGAQKNRLIEMVILWTQNIWLRNKKINSNNALLSRGLRYHIKQILTIQSTNHFGMMSDNDPISLGRVKPTL